MNRMAQGRLRRTQPGGGAGEVPLFGDGEEGRQFAQFIAPHS